jgi:hypothetical protein
MINHEKTRVSKKQEKVSLVASTNKEKENQ